MGVRPRPWGCVAVLAVVYGLSAGPVAASPPTTPCVAAPVIVGDRPGGALPAVVPVARPAAAPLNVASLNIAGGGRVAESLSRWIAERSLDVLLLQEVGGRSTDGEAFIAEWSRRHDLSFVYAPANSYGGGTAQGLAIVSRYPLSDVRLLPLAYNRLSFRSRCRIALAATVHTAGGAVRFVNLHLDTRLNSGRRVEQMASALDAAAFDGPRIVGGDLNTMNIGWLQSMWPLPFAQRQADAVRTLLLSEGYETPFGSGRPTFKLLGLPLRLDWLFLRGLRALEWGVDDVPFTDHRGVWAELLMPPAATLAD